jgi:hypothetical protein
MRGVPLKRTVSAATGYIKSFLAPFSVDPNNSSSTTDLPRRAQAWRVSSFWFIDYIAAREHKEHRDSLRSICSFGMDERPRNAWIYWLFLEIAKYLFFSLGLFRAGGIKLSSHGV